MKKTKSIGPPEEDWWKQLCKQSNMKKPNLESFLRRCGIAYAYHTLWELPANKIFAHATQDEVADAILMLNCCSIATWLFYMPSFAKLYKPSGTIHASMNNAIQDFKGLTSLRMGFIEPTSNDIKIYINSGTQSPLDAATLYPVDSRGNNFSGKSYITELLNTAPTKVQNVDVTFLRNLVKRKVIKASDLKVADVLYLDEGETYCAKMNVLDQALPPYEVNVAIHELPPAFVEEHNGNVFTALLDMYEAMDPGYYSNVVHQYLLNNLNSVQQNTPTVPVFQSIEVPENIETMSGKELLESLTNSDIATDSLGSGIRKYLDMFNLDDNISVKQLIEWDEQGSDENNKPTPSVVDCVEVLSNYIEQNDISYDVNFAGLAGYITDEASNVPGIRKPTPTDTEYSSEGLREIVAGFNSRNPDRKFTIMTEQELADATSVKASATYNKLDSIINRNLSSNDSFKQTFKDTLNTIDICHKNGEISDIEYQALTDKVKLHSTELELAQLRESIANKPAPAPAPAPAHPELDDLLTDKFFAISLYGCTELKKLFHPHMKPSEYAVTSPLTQVTTYLINADRGDDIQDAISFVERYINLPTTADHIKVILNKILDMLKDMA